MDTRLQGIPLLQSLSEAALQVLWDQGRLHTSTYARGALIHWEGDPCRNLDIVLSGQVDVQRLDENGEILTIATFYPGETFGGNRIFSQNPIYPMTVVAVTETDLLHISRSQLLALCQGHPDFLIAFLEDLSDHALLLGNKIKYTMKRTIRQSLLELFTLEALRQGANPFVLPLSKTALADRLGIHRTSLSREMTKMADDGLIAYDRKTVTLLTKAKGAL